MQLRRPSRGGRKAVAPQGSFSAGNTFVELVHPEKTPAAVRPVASSSSTRANRSQGRGAKPRAGGIKPAGSLAAERMRRFGR